MGIFAISTAQPILPCPALKGYTQPRLESRMLHHCQQMILKGQSKPTRSSPSIIATRTSCQPPLPFYSTTIIIMHHPYVITRALNPPTLYPPIEGHAPDAPQISRDNILALSTCSAGQQQRMRLNIQFHTESLRS